MEPFESWLERQYRYAAGAMLASVSAVNIVKARPGFGHEIRPVKGSIIASPVPASYDPDPDYFFHWFRDSAVVIDAIRLLFEEGAMGEEALEHVADFVRFSLSLRKLDGNTLVSDRNWRTKVRPDFEKFVREDPELATVVGDAVAADTRVNPDATIDISRWTRPQHDGPPLRALALLRWLEKPEQSSFRAVRRLSASSSGRESFDPEVRSQIEDLIHGDLAFTYQHWREPSYDIWEEESGQHYYTLCVSAAALNEGAAWLKGQDDEQAHTYRAESETIRKRLQEFWLPEEKHYRSRVLASGARSTKELDIAIILSAIHAASDTNADVVHDPHMHETFARLETLFAQSYPINRDLPAGRAPAMGRYAGDVYYSGGAYYFSTLGAAEFCYRAARGRDDALTWVRKGDAYLATVRAFTPESGELSEQFDQRTGAQSSARHLAWSYAALISARHARRAVAGPVR